MTGDILDARDRFRTDGNPTAVLMTPEDVFELARLRQLERDLHRPIIELLVELTALRIVGHEAQAAMAKVVEHKEKRWAHIKVGAFDRLGRALEAWRNR